MLKSHSQNPDTPFIGSILEARFHHDDLDELFDRFTTEFKKLNIENVDMEAHETGGSAHTNELILRISRGVDVETKPIGFRKLVDTHIKKDITQSKDKFEQHKNVYDTFNLRKNIRDPKNSTVHPYAAQQNHFRASDKGPEWYRDGFIYEVQHLQGTGKAISIATIHAPGPNSGREEIVRKTISDVMATHNPDVLIGDLNLRKNITHETHFDLRSLRPGGTTLRKNDLEETGNSRWDQAHVKNELQDQVSPLVFSLAKSESIQKLVSDHGMISLMLKDDSAVMDRTTALSPFAGKSDAAPLGQPDNPLHVFAGPKADGTNLRSRETSPSGIGPVRGGNKRAGVISRYFTPY